MAQFSQAISKASVQLASLRSNNQLALNDAAAGTNTP